MKSKVPYMLDGVADRLEARGLIKEAYEIDKAANSIEAADFSGIEEFLNNVAQESGINAEKAIVKQESTGVSIMVGVQTKPDADNLVRLYTDKYMMPMHVEQVSGKWYAVLPMQM